MFYSLCVNKQNSHKHPEFNETSAENSTFLATLSFFFSHSVPTVTADVEVHKSRNDKIKKEKRKRSQNAPRVSTRPRQLFLLRFKPSKNTRHGLKWS